MSILLFLLLLPLAGFPSPELSAVEYAGALAFLNDPDCPCYPTRFSLTCICEGKVRVRLKETAPTSSPRAALHVRLTCAGGDTRRDPYEYLSRLDLTPYSEGAGARHGSVHLQVTGCPGRRYSTALTAGRPPTFRLAGLDVRCGDRAPPPPPLLRKEHLQGLGDLASLAVDWPSLREVAPDFLSGVTGSLESLSITNTGLRGFPAGFFLRFGKLRTLHVSGNRLESLESLQGLVNLRFFRADGNRLVHLSDDLFGPTRALMTLRLSGNLLRSLPLSLCRLTSLFSLHLPDNGLGGFMDGCLVRLSGLNYLEASRNRLASLGSSGDPASAEGTTTPPLFFPGNVSFLDLQENDLRSVPEGAFHRLARLKKVNLSSNGLAGVPAALLRDNPRLQTLDLSSDDLSAIPEGFLSSNARLRHLFLRGNRIGALGAGTFRGLLLLRSVDLGDNLLTSLPGDLFLPLLRATPDGGDGLLDLGGNLLTSLPNLTLPWLTRLSAARNRLTSLPAAALAHVPLLEVADLSGNLIPDWAPEESAFRSELPRLARVDLSGNRFRGLPDLGWVEGRLESLDLSGNRIEVAPRGASHSGSRDSARQGSLFAGRFPRMRRLDLSRNAVGKHGVLLELGADFCDELGSVARERRGWRNWTEHLSKEHVVSCECLSGGGGVCLSFVDSLQRLEVLILSHNRFRFIPVSYKSLTGLRLLDLSHNLISRISFDHFFHVSSLTGWILGKLGESEGNYVRRGDLYEMTPTRDLKIDLRHNRIASFDLADGKMRTVPKGCHVDREFSRATVFLGNNPLVCNCRVFALLRYAAGELRPVSDWEAWKGVRRVLPVKVDVGGLSCWEPVSLRGKPLSEPEVWTHHLLPLTGLCRVLQGHP